MQEGKKKRTIAITGASGFVGSALLERFSKDDLLNLVGISRSEKESDNPNRLVWRKADLFSLKQAEDAFAGVDVIVYLVHSMQPSNPLVQGNFRDFDFIIADNVRRAAETCGVSQIIYLSGLMPKEKKLSMHMFSRFEVEAALQAGRTPTTVLRAGMIVGPGGASFEMLHQLVNRLPYMLAPKWLRNRHEPVALVDVVDCIHTLVGQDRDKHATYDIGCGKDWTYQKMIGYTAEATGKSPTIYQMPVSSLRFSKLWVTVVTGQSKKLVYPLLDSLIHEMVCDQKKVFPLGRPYTSFEFAVAEALGSLSQSKEKAKRHARASAKVVSKTATSVQRALLPKGMTAKGIADRYLIWLPWLFRFIITVEIKNNSAEFKLLQFRKPLLILKLSEQRSTPDRALFYVKGGMLNHKESKGRLEFREVNNGKHLIAAVYDFKPSLPWWLYVATQALAHLLVMNLFKLHLKRLYGEVSKTSV